MRHYFYHTDSAQYFTILQYKLPSFNIQDDRSTQELLAKPSKKFLKSPIRPASSHFYLMVLSMCNLQKRLIRAAFWVFLQAMFTERLKRNDTAIKITRETTNNQ